MRSRALLHTSALGFFFLVAAPSADEAHRAVAADLGGTFLGPDGPPCPSKTTPRS